MNVPPYWRYNFQDGYSTRHPQDFQQNTSPLSRSIPLPESDWTLELDGRDIGGVSYTVAKPFLEEAIACQFGADHKATYTDSKGRVWEGMPLWFFPGFVDDADQHSANAYNETKALAGYNIVITGIDGYTTTVSSKDIIRSSNYLVANSLNGTHIADSDENWPLRFTGDNVNGTMTVKGVKSIKLIRIGEPPVTLTPMTIMAKCPVDISMTDPEGHTVNNLINEITGAVYSEPTMGSDGRPDPQIFIPKKIPGIYIITVTPKPGVSSTETFTLEIESDGVIYKLADNVPVSAIPSEPYRIQVKADGGIIILGGGAIPTPEFPSLVFPVVMISAMVFLVNVYPSKVKYHQSIF